MTGNASKRNKVSLRCLEAEENSTTRDAQAAMQGPVGNQKRLRAKSNNHLFDASESDDGVC